MTEQLVRIHTRTTIILHWINVISIFSLVLTGFYLYAPESFNILPSAGWGFGLHMLFAFILIVTMIIKAIYVLSTGEIKQLLFKSKDAKRLPTLINHYLKKSKKGFAEEDKYNAGQKLLYTLWPIALIVQIVLGFTLTFKDAFLGFNQLLGGVENVLYIHLIFTWIFTITVVGHIVLVLINNYNEYLRGILTGYAKRRQ